MLKLGVLCDDGGLAVLETDGCWDGEFPRTTMTLGGGGCKAPESSSRVVVPGGRV